MNADLLDLPWQVQVSLASGYSAYVLAYAGNRAHHRTVDTIFITFVFGLIALSIYLSINPKTHTVAAGFITLIFSAVVGLLWRKIGKTGLEKVLRETNFSWSNDDPSALVTLSNNSKHEVSQIAVHLTDGTWLRCDNTSQFVNAPYSPCLIGPNGDVAIYLTHTETPKGDSVEAKTVFDPDLGYRLTYIPAAMISRISIRHK